MYYAFYTLYEEACPLNRLIIHLVTSFVRFWVTLYLFLCNFGNLVHNKSNIIMHDPHMRIFIYNREDKSKMDFILLNYMLNHFT